MTVTADVRERQRAAVERWLRVFHRLPGEVVELRALGVQGRKAVGECFADPAALAARACELDGAGAKGCYFTLNPLRPQLAGAKASCRAADVVRRHWLPIDSDSVREVGTNATDGERQAAWEVLDRARGLLDGAGLHGAVVGDSGNGWHLCYPVDLPADDASQALVKAVLAGLASRCDTPGVAVLDRKVFDAPRIWKLYGTRARKGEHSAERPHRWTRLIEGEPWEQPVAAANTARLTGLPEQWRRIEDLRRGRPDGAGGLSAMERARLYTAKMPPAVSGQNGHGSTFEVAQVLVRGFGLSDQEAWPILCDYTARCQPPWSEKELRHKLADARQKSGLPAGYLLGEGCPAPVPSANGQAAGPLPAAAPAAPEPQPWEAPVPIDDGLPAEPFPVDVLPECLRPFVSEAAWAINCPPDFVAVPLLAAAGAAIGNTLRLAIKRKHTQGAELFTVVVGMASSGKSPALELVTEPFEDAQRRHQQEHKAALKRWREEGCQGDKPVLRQLLADDATVEALAPLMGENPRGLLMVRDEMAALVSGMNQYKDGKGSDRQFILKLWPQATIRVHRVKNEGGIPMTVHRPFLGLVGGIQPSVVDSLRQQAEKGKTAIEDGFLDRFLFSYPPRLPAVGEQWREVSQEATEAWGRVVARLLELPLNVDDAGWVKPQLLRLSSDGARAWEEFTAAHAAEINAPGFPDHFIGPWGKLAAYCGRLALIAHMLREVTGEVIERAVDGESMARAARLVAYFKSHFRRTYHALGADPRALESRTILSWVVDQQKATFTRRDLWRAMRYRFSRPEDLDAPLKLLAHLGHVRVVENRTAPMGRPSQRWEVNPSLFSTWDNGTEGTEVDTK